MLPPSVKHCGWMPTAALPVFGEGGGREVPLQILAKPVRACKPKNQNQNKSQNKNQSQRVRGGGVA